MEIKKTALIIIDIQNDYFEGGANPLVGSAQAATEAKRLLDWFRDNNQRVIHIQHLSIRPGSTFFIPGTPGAEIHSLVKPVSGEKIVVKNYPNSFKNTDLNDYLKENDITDLVICGMMTHMCVDATVRAAKDWGYNCTLISNACATKDLEWNHIQTLSTDVHHSFLAALSYYYANVITSDEFFSMK